MDAPFYIDLEQVKSLAKTLKLTIKIYFQNKISPKGTVTKWKDLYIIQLTNSSPSNNILPSVKLI